MLTTSTSRISAVIIDILFLFPLVDKVDFDNQTNEVKLEMVNENKNGLLDGGYTFKIIRNYLEGLSDYEEIKNVLKDQFYAENIAYKEFELLDDGSKKNIDIKDVLSYLICFDVESFSGEKHPIKAYSTKASVVQRFRDNKERMLKYIPLLPVILELRDFIYLELQ